MLVAIHYYLEIPSDIIDYSTNAVNRNKVEWQMLKVSQIREVYAKCKTPFLPGLEAFSTLCILLIAFIRIEKK